MNIFKIIGSSARMLVTVAMLGLFSQSAFSQVDGVDPLPEEKEDIIAGIDMRHWNFDVRAGYSIGGTMPMDMPAEMRHINSFSPKFNYRFGLDIEYRFNPSWGLQSGAYIERKGFQGDMSVRGYQITMRQGSEEISGPFTGNVVTNIVQTGVTIPLQAAWWINRKLKLRFGPYISIVTDKSFNGYAYGNEGADGNPTAYLRRDDAKGDLVYIGNDEGSRGTFGDDTFKEYMRTMQYGVDMGCDWFFSRHWGVFGDLSYGFNSAFNGKEGNPVNMDLYPLYFTVGVVYKIGR